MKIYKHNMRCFQDHIGKWVMDEGHFYALYNLIMSEELTFDNSVTAAEEDDGDGEDEMTPQERQKQDDIELTTITSGGIMIIPMEGTMMRGVSSFGGVSTVQIRRVLRMAASNNQVKGILLRADSPGGTVAGTDELADEIKVVGQIKPIRTHVEGLMASAMFWVGSQSSLVTASKTSQIGSLGTVAVVNDFSEMAKKDGIKVNVISTGPFKGAFTPGSEVTKAQLDDLQNIVDELNEVFMEAVQDGRGMDAKQVKKLFDGRVHVAGTALKLGLIDSISTFEQAIRSFENDVFEGDDGAEAALAKAKAARIRSNI